MWSCCCGTAVAGAAVDSKAGLEHPDGWNYVPDGWNYVPDGWRCVPPSLVDAWLPLIASVSAVVAESTIKLKSTRFLNFLIGTKKYESVLVTWITEGFLLPGIDTVIDRDGDPPS